MHVPADGPEEKQARTICKKMQILHRIALGAESTEHNYIKYINVSLIFLWLNQGAHEE